MGMPGKFEGNEDQDLARALLELTLDSGQDDELGDVQDYGTWYALILDYRGRDKDTGRFNVKSYIVSEDSQGFFDYREFDTADAARAEWANYVEEYEEWESQFAEET